MVAESGAEVPLAGARAAREMGHPVSHGRVREAGRVLPTPFAESVLDLVMRIPPGLVLTYGDVAVALGHGGARAVGTTLARFGTGVPWHRVVRVDGRPAAGHTREAMSRLRAEGTPLLGSPPDRVDLARARWRPPTDRRDDLSDPAGVINP